MSSDILKDILDDHTAFSSDEEGPESIIPPHVRPEETNKYDKPRPTSPPPRSPPSPRGQPPPPRKSRSPPPRELVRHSPSPPPRRASPPRHDTSPYQRPAGPREDARSGPRRHGEDRAPPRGQERRRPSRERDGGRTRHGNESRGREERRRSSSSSSAAGSSHGHDSRPLLGRGEDRPHGPHGDRPSHPHPPHDRLPSHASHASHLDRPQPPRDGDRPPMHGDRPHLHGDRPPMHGDRDRPHSDRERERERERPHLMHGDRDRKPHGDRQSHGNRNRNAPAPPPSSSHGGENPYREAGPPHGASLSPRALASVRVPSKRTVRIYDPSPDIPTDEPIRDRFDFFPDWHRLGWECTTEVLLSFKNARGPRGARPDIPSHRDGLWNRSHPCGPGEPLGPTKREYFLIYSAEDKFKQTAREQRWFTPRGPIESSLNSARAHADVVLIFYSHTVLGCARLTSPIDCAGDDIISSCTLGPVLSGPIPFAQFPALPPAEISDGKPLPEDLGKQMSSALGLAPLDGPRGNRPSEERRRHRPSPQREGRARREYGSPYEGDRNRRPEQADANQRRWLPKGKQRPKQYWRDHPIPVDMQAVDERILRDHLANGVRPKSPPRGVDARQPDRGPRHDRSHRR